MSETRQTATTQAEAGVASSLTSRLAAEAVYFELVDSLKHARLDIKLKLFPRVYQLFKAVVVGSSNLCDRLPVFSLRAYFFHFFFLPE